MPIKTTTQNSNELNWIPRGATTPSHGSNSNSGSYLSKSRDTSSESPRRSTGGSTLQIIFNTEIKDQKSRKKDSKPGQGTSKNAKR